MVVFVYDYTPSFSRRNIGCSPIATRSLILDDYNGFYAGADFFASGNAWVLNPVNGERVLIVFLVKAVAHVRLIAFAVCKKTVFVSGIK
jgi:hypothetical protein